MKQRLKSLELHGYKTFASKTRFEFPDQITAIVGPNGSGKSNIADAIRWVLGEQAYTILRGKKTVDMIFAGSEYRPRASMASATIVFDNEDNWLPIDYSEVSLTRRAYRSGENEYLLNNTKVRLKEINELLANSGLSERTYTIIGQGLVDAALSLKPEERRRFFEEAAGIELYRSRRDEAIQKLDNTLRNMDRVRDILSELVPRLKSLEKQSERAKEYDRIKADLLIYLRDWYGFQWNKIQEEFKFSKEMLQKQDEQLNIAREMQSALNVKLENFRADISKKRTDLAQWHKESSIFHQQEEQINREIAVLHERKNSLEEKKLDLEREMTILEEQNNLRQKQREEFDREKTQRTEDLIKAGNSYEEINKRIKNRSDQRQKIETEIKAIRFSVEQWETRKIQIHAQTNELDHRIALLRKNIEDLKSTYDKDRTEAENLEHDISHQLEKSSAIQNEIEILTKEASNQDRLIIELENKLKNNQNENSQLEARKLSKQAQFEVIENAEQTFSGFTSGSKTLYDAFKAGKVSGNIELLLSQLRVPAEYEVAIASVLGELLESVILDDSTDPEKAMKFIEENESGRTALLVKSWMKIGPDGIKKYQTDNVISAKDIVLVNGPFQLFVNALLHNVFIVKDRKAARQLLSSSGDDIKVVTLKGEVYYPNGVVIAGKEVRVTTISRTREKDALQKALETINLNLEDLKKQLQENSKKIGDLILEKKKLDEKRTFQQKIKLDITDQLNDLTNQLNQLKTRMNWQSEQIKVNEQQLVKGVEEKKKIAEEEEELSEKVKFKKLENENLFAQLKELSMEGLQEELFIRNANKVVEEQAVNNLNLRINEIQTQIDSIKVEKEKNVIKNGETEKSLKELHDKSQMLSEQEKIVETKLNELDEKITPTEKKLKESELDEEKLQLEQDQTRQQFTIVERHSIQAQMKLSRVREQQESLKRRIEEDFGLVFYEYGQAVDGPTPLPIEGMVESLPKLTQVPDELEENIKQQKTIIRRMGPINPEAQKEFKEVKERHQFITEQLKDLEKAESGLRQVVKELDELMKTEFQKTFKKVNEVFKEIFEKLFDGGSANLIIANEEDLAESGIDIEATLPGKRKQELASLSGGERSLTAVALIFALLKVSPTPFCILDEVDAMLDESNVMRFGDLLRELSLMTQFIVITHNRNTVQLANVLYGVTMGKDSTTQVISLKLDELTEDLVQ